MRTVAKPGIGPWLPAPSPPPEPWGPGAVHPEGTCTSQPLPGTDRVCPCLDCRGAPTSVTVASGERAGGTGRGSYLLPCALCTAWTAPHGQELPTIQFSSVGIAQKPAHQPRVCGLHTSGLSEALRLRPRYGPQGLTARPVEGEGHTSRGLPTAVTTFTKWPFE